jgi:hypothetical protein
MHPFFVPTFALSIETPPPGKQHKDVMKAIRNMEPAWLKVNGRKFALVEYQDMATMECGLTVKQQEKLVPIIAHSWAMK